MLSAANTRYNSEKMSGASGLDWIRLTKPPDQDAYWSNYQVNHISAHDRQKDLLHYLAEVVSVQLFLIRKILKGSGAFQITDRLIVW